MSKKVQHSTGSKASGSKQITLAASAAAVPSANWRALQKKSRISSDSISKPGHVPLRLRKKRKLSDGVEAATAQATVVDFPRGEEYVSKNEKVASSSSHVRFLESFGEERSSILLDLQNMVRGEIKTSSKSQNSSRFVALDCEMVGVGPEGSESVLARVSIVNWHGEVLLDEFVRPRERVVDYRTQYSGVRERDLVNAKSFEDVQRQAAELMKGKVVVGHAVSNDLKALLLSHPRPMIRDTQQLAAKHKLSKSRRPALRVLVQKELGLAIQDGEHSSVTDARATIALYRLHRKVWDNGWRPLPTSLKRKKSTVDDEDGEDATEPKIISGGQGRKGVSSGLSTVIKRVRRTSNISDEPPKKWWDDLPEVKQTSFMARESTNKGSLKIKIATSIS